jgi:hypothetical protein
MAEKIFPVFPVRRAVVSQRLAQLLPRWQNNTSPEDLGIIRFAFDLFPHKVNPAYGLADWVRPTLYKILRYRPGMTKIDRAWAVCTSREFSKTTWAEILVLYGVLVGQYGIYSDSKFLLPEMDFIRMRAKTSDEAEKRLNNVSVEFSSNAVIGLFGDLRPTLKDVKDRKFKNTGKLLILLNNYILLGQGLNQPARGANIFSKRPKFDIDDDVENKENTKTPGMRTYNAQEILGEQFGGLDPNGLTLYIGNYVHQNCIMSSLQKENSGWHRLFYQATYYDKDGVERSGWAKRFSVDYFRRLGEWYRNQPDLGGWKTFMMEYYNQIVSDKDYQIKYWDGSYFRQDGRNFIAIRDQLNPKEYKRLRAFIVVSLDPAISEEKTACDSAVTVTAFGADNNRYVLDCSMGKFDDRDRYYNEAEIRNFILARTPEQLAKVKRIGGVEETARMILKYHADAFVIENAGQQLAWYNDLVALFAKMSIPIPDGLPYHPTDEKKYKLRTGLLNWFSAGMYYLLKTMRFMKVVESQIATFPDSKLDTLDALHNAEKMGRIPTQSDFDSLGNALPDPDLEEYVVPDDVEAWVVM